MVTTKFEGASEDLNALYEATHQAASEAGADADKANLLATRQCHHAGYYQTKDGWQRLGPDLRGKVNIREAEEQPDGKFLVRGVDVFYPNAVKGAEAETQWTPDRIYQAIENTNHSVETGAQKPAVTRTHIYPEQKILGVNVPSYGNAINFRESSRGHGWVQCDLVDVHPSVVNDWKDKQITGLSVGFVKDAGGLGERFGHVALLGGESQALSALPATELYSADGYQLCYSTDEAEVSLFAANPNVPSKDQTSKEGLVGPDVKLTQPTQPPATAKETVMDPNQAKMMKDAYAGMQTAFAGMEAGEPGADEKVAEAHRALQEACEACKMDGGGAPAPAPGGPMPGNPMGGDQMGYAHDGPEDKENHNEYAAGSTSQEAQAPSFLPEAQKGSPADMHKITPTDIDVGTHPGSNEFSAELVDLRKRNHNLELAVSAMVGRQMRTDFSAEVQGLAESGHQIDLPAAMQCFEACDGNQERLVALRNLLGKSPKSSLTKAEPTFAADGNAAPRDPNRRQPGITPDDDAEVLEILRRKAPGLNFSAEDVRIGTLATGNNPGATGGLTAY